MPAAAQVGASGTLKGSVQTAAGEPIPYASVILKGTGYGTQTSEDGRFSLEAAAGTYTLAVTYAGQTLKELQVLVRAGGTTEPGPIIVETTSRQLQEVVINSSFNKFSRKESESVARLPIRNLENPQVYNVIPRELTEEQAVVDYLDALRNITGAAVAASNNSTPQAMLRGFRSFSGARNGLLSYTFVAIDPVNIETIEAIKGPSATLFGSGSGNFVTFGGLMNRVTKKPYNGFGGEVGFATGSWGLSRLTADINTPLNEERTALLRTNAAFHTENSFQDAGYQRNRIIAPSFSYQVNDRLSVKLDAELYRTDRALPANFRFSAGTVSARNFKDLPLDYRNSLSSNDLVSKVGTNNFFARADYRLSDRWTSSTRLAYTMTEYYDAYRLYTQWQTDSTIMRAVMAQKPQRQIAMTAQQNFTGDFMLGPFRNRLVLGIDYNRQTHDLRYTGVIPYDEVNLHDLGGHDVSTARLNSLLAEVNFNNQSGEEHAYSVYASDLLNFTDQLMAMFSLRLTRYNNKGIRFNGSLSGDYLQTSWSPKFGLVYQPLPDKIALFANYMNGFANQGGVDFNGEAFKPRQAWQWETGIKLDLWENRLNATFSYYDITVENVLRTDQEHAGFSIQDGTQQSKGFEAEIVANPFSGLNLIAGYGYNDNRYTKANANIEGNRPLGTPEHSVNGWMSYKVPAGVLSGWGIGLGGNYASESYFDDANTFVIPAYTVLNAALFYEKRKYRIGLKMNNLTDEQYWSYVGAPQNPRQVIVNIAYRF